MFSNSRKKVKVAAKARFILAGINPAATQKDDQRFVGAGFTPARIEPQQILIAQIRLQ